MCLINGRVINSSIVLVPIRERERDIYIWSRKSSSIYCGSSSERWDVNNSSIYTEQHKQKAFTFTNTCNVFLYVLFFLSNLVSSRVRATTPLHPMQVPIVIAKTKDMRNSTNIFLINLSIADLFVLVVCTPTVLVEVNTKPETWILGHGMCK